MQAPVPVAGQAPAKVAPIAGPQLWLADTAPARDAAWAARHTAWLSPSERSRLDRIRAADRRAQLLAGHVLLRRLVAAAAGVAADSVGIRSDDEGRPLVESPLGWGASLAHSGRCVAALVSVGPTTPGVDIERHKPRRDIVAIVHTACGVDAASADEAYLVWAQHEAELKAGRGDAGVWLATWDGHALAACTTALPRAAWVNLDADDAPRPLDLVWTHRARLPAATWTQ